MTNYQDDKFFDFFLKKFGQPHDCQIIDDKVVKIYQDIVPPQLISYWHSFGWCGYANGLLWMTNPIEYQDILVSWLKGTSFEKRNDLSVVARSAFGELYVWCKGKGYLMLIRPITGVINFYPEDYEKSLSLKEENKIMSYFWGGRKKDFVDYNDENSQPLFERALKKLGSLKSDEMYGLKHARMLGGSITLDNLDIMKIDVYHDIARQMDDPEIIVIDTSD